VAAHAENVAGDGRERPNSDERIPRLYDQCRATLDRLDVFRREWLGAGQPELVGSKRWPGALDVEKAGLLAAAEDAAACVQQRLHALPLPLLLDESVELWTARRWYLEALIYLDGNRLAKDVETRVSPGGQPLAICVGSAKRELVVVYVRGRVQEIEMRGYIGCLRTFPDTPFGRGKRWPRLCPDCRTRRSNATKKARTALQRRVADLSR
jgi:hypothetical protein